MCKRNTLLNTLLAGERLYSQYFQKLDFIILSSHSVGTNSLSLLHKSELFTVIVVKVTASFFKIIVLPQDTATQQEVLPMLGL